MPPTKGSLGAPTYNTLKVTQQCKRFLRLCPAPRHMARRTKVVVLGGGFAGTALAVKLAADDKLDVTLISRTEFFEVAFANARALVEPSIADKVVWPYKDMKPHGTFIQGEVAALTETAVTLKDGRQITFDFAAIATGSDYAFGKSAATTTTEGRKAELQALADRVKAASKVTVVGGGPLGVELAGEILTDLPGVQVTLVHRGPQLLPTLPARLGSAALWWLQRKGCKVLFNERVDVPAGASGGPFSGTTKGGVQVDCDVLLAATGISVNSAFMQPHLADALDEQGRIKVDKHLRVAGHPRLFALGDVTNIPEEKLAFLSAQHGTLVAANLSALAAVHAAAGDGGGAEDALAAAGGKLRAWRPSMGVRVMFVSIGRDYGVGRIGWLALTGFIPTRLKSRNILGFADKYRQELLLAP